MSSKIYHEIVKFIHRNGIRWKSKSRQRLLFLQKLLWMWHCLEKWQKGCHLQSIWTTMPTDDEWTKLLPKVHDLWPSYWVYPALQSQLLKDLTIEWLGSKHLHSWTWLYESHCFELIVNCQFNQKIKQKTKPSTIYCVAKLKSLPFFFPQTKILLLYEISKPTKQC